ncbi:MAG: acyl-CoA carboxylase subunit beta, partial [Terrabacter sp.]|nr:acyl-CoA carboxylase subunit beta [Terrabacter sp.]
MTETAPSTTSGATWSPDPHGDPRVADVRARLAAAHTASASAPEKAQAKLDAQGKIYVRDRIALLFDEGSFVEDGRYANALQPGLPADGVVT